MYDTLIEYFVYQMTSQVVPLNELTKRMKIERGFVLKYFPHNL